MLAGYHASEIRPVSGGVPQNDAVLPRYRSIGGCRGCGEAEGDQYRTMTAGHVAGALAGGILAGMLFMWVWKERRASA